MLRNFVAMLLWIVLIVCVDSVCSSEATLQNLTRKPVLSVVPMKEWLRRKGYNAEFDGEVYFVKLKDDLNAVFKVQPEQDMGDAFAEVAAYKASKFLGFPEIPPTIIRKVNGKMGSLQLYVEPFVDPTRPNVYKDVMRSAHKEDVSNLKLFYFVFGQWDTGAHNIVFTKDQGRVKWVAIDNSGIRNHQFVQYGDLPFVRVFYSDALNTHDWHLPFPWKKVKIIRDPSIENLIKVFGNTIPNHILKNLSKYGTPIHYVIYRNSLWRQYHKEDPNFDISHTNDYPEKSILALKKLNRGVLEKIFSHAKGADFLTNAYLQAILERRDQVIKAYKKQREHKT